MPQHKMIVELAQDDYEAFEAYSELTGTPMHVAISEALSDYREVTIGARMETLSTKPSNVVCISEAASA